MANNKKLNTTEFVDKAKQIHSSRYDYSKSFYINSHIKIEIICPIHGPFLQKPNNHLSGQGCWLCGISKRQKTQTKSIEKFIEDAIKVHNNLYDYSVSFYTNNETKIKIKCNRCNTIFDQKPNAHLNGQGCPICNRNHYKSIFDCRETKKICKKCGIEKEMKNFYIGNHKNKKYVYYRGNCKRCERQIKVEYRKLLSSKKRRRKYEKVYSRERRKIDPAFKLKKDCSSIVRRVLNGDKRNYSLWKILPYNPNELKRHLESQFDENMSWNNHGIYWHIDHIIPQVMLKYDSLEHPNFLKCWSLSNLRPLKIEDNLHKSSIFEGINYRGKKSIYSN